MALVQPREIEQIGAGILLTVGAGAVNLLLGVYLIRVGKRSNSLAIEADGRHIMTDVVTSVGVVGGLVAVRLTGWHVLDPLVAILLAINILVSGSKLVRASAGHLMDEADEGLLDGIVSTLSGLRRPGDIQPHRLRATRHGSRLNLDFHIFMPRFWSLTEVHDRVETIERVLGKELNGEVEPVIHVDPCEPAHCVLCSFEPCSVRASAMTEEDAWDRIAIASPGGPVAASEPHPK